MNVYKLIGTKILRCISLLLGVSIFAFLLLKVAPVDRETYIADNPAAYAIEGVVVEKPAITQEGVVAQYWHWLKGIVVWDFGKSYITGQDVTTMVKDKAVGTITLILVSWFISGIIGFFLGSLAAFNRGSLFDKFIKLFAYLQISMPIYWVGMLFILIFSAKLQLFPLASEGGLNFAGMEVTFTQRLIHFTLIVITLSIFGIANVTMHTRTKMIEVLNSNYVLLAKARGLSNFQIFRRHCIKNAIVPAITMHFSSFGELFGGEVLAEEVFSFDGLGTLLTDSGMHGDTPLLLALVLLGAFFVFMGNLVADLLTALVNPKLRRGL